MAGAIVGELLNAAFGVNVDIEMILRDVDADGDLICRWCYWPAHLFLSHACHPGRLNTQVSVRASRKRRGRSNSSSVSRPAFSRSVPLPHRGWPARRWGTILPETGECHKTSGIRMDSLGEAAGGAASIDLPLCLIRAKRVQIAKGTDRCNGSARYRNMGSRFHSPRSLARHRKRH
jgi:hypothetical protein